MGRQQMMKTAACVTLILLCSLGAVARAAPKAELWQRWEAHDPQGEDRVDHVVFSAFLERYVDDAHPSGVYRVRYGDISAGSREELASYVRSLEGVAVDGLTRAEQKAYWINLYNALTLAVILENYPVESIRDIDISPGLFADGPWGAKLVTIEGEKVSLNDIEHRILRPIWKDPRVHYAVNCASIGCPNLQTDAFTAGNTERLLEKGAADYVNHPRGAEREGKKLMLSSIYDWFRQDFGGTEAGVVEHLMQHAREPLRSELGGFQGKVKYRYDWGLNE
jgi:hypothetical protein